MEEIPLAEEDDPNFDYPATYDWKEGDYMWLLFKIQQHFAHREVWTRVYRYLSHTQPLHMENHEQALVGLTESWQELFDKSIQVKRAARRALEAAGRDKGGPPRAKLRRTASYGYLDTPCSTSLGGTKRDTWTEGHEGTPVAEEE